MKTMEYLYQYHSTPFDLTPKGVTKILLIFLSDNSKRLFIFILDNKSFLNNCCLVVAYGVSLSCQTDIDIMKNQAKVQQVENGLRALGLNFPVGVEKIDHETVIFITHTPKKGNAFGVDVETLDRYFSADVMLNKYHDMIKYWRLTEDERMAIQGHPMQWCLNN